MKTKEELMELKTEVETLNEKRRELTQDELEMVTGGNQNDNDIYDGYGLQVGDWIRYCPDDDAWNNYRYKVTGINTTYYYVDTYKNCGKEATAPYFCQMIRFDAFSPTRFRRSEAPDATFYKI